jgi:hypothetical protein
MAPRFRAVLLVGRQLTAEYDARDEQAAEDIARFLFDNDRAFFRADSEDIVDCLIEQTGEAAS